MTKSTRRIVSFELPTATFQALEEDAASRGSNSLHQRAREIVIDHLSDQGTEELTNSVAALDSDIAYLGDLLRRVAYSVIVHAAGRDSTEANKWIRENMSSRGNV